MKSKLCKQCGAVVTARDPRTVFCCKSCSGTYNNTGRRPSNETKKLISESMIVVRKTQTFPSGEAFGFLVGKATRGKFREKCPESLLELSKRTVGKILARLKVGCSRCQWKEGRCDIHHINGRKIPDPHNHRNLCLLCPNCHRLAHENKVPKETLVSLEAMVGEKWKKFYFG